MKLDLDPKGGVFENHPESNQGPSNSLTASQQSVEELSPQHLKSLCDGVTISAKRHLMQSLSEVGENRSGAGVGTDAGQKSDKLRLPPPMMVNFYILIRLVFLLLIL